MTHALGGHVGVAPLLERTLLGHLVRVRARARVGVGVRGLGLGLGLGLEPDLLGHRLGLSRRALGQLPGQGESEG